jgi:hypothetical protein
MPLTHHSKGSRLSATGDRLGGNQLCKVPQYYTSERFRELGDWRLGCGIWLDRFKMAGVGITLIQGGEELHVRPAAISAAVVAGSAPPRRLSADTLGLGQIPDALSPSLFGMPTHSH